MSEQSSGGSNASLKQLRLGLKVAAKNWLLLLLLPGLAYGYARFVTHKQLDMFGAQTEILLEQKDEYDKAREIMEGVVSRRFQRQGPDIANQIRVLKSRDLVAKAVGDLDHNIWPGKVNSKYNAPVPTQQDNPVFLFYVGTVLGRL